MGVLNIKEKKILLKHQVAIIFFRKNKTIFERVPWKSSFLLALFLNLLIIGSCNNFLVHQVTAVGGWNGDDFYYVPIAWSAVNGSPAMEDPNVPSYPGGPADTTTDAVLLRRCERPSVHIYSEQAGIAFRSAMQIGMEPYIHPIVGDYNITCGTLGDVRGDGYGWTEINKILNEHWYKWQYFGYASLGIDTINVGLFHDGTGNYVSILGWGAADGPIIVVDNHFLYPGIPDRTFPGSTNQFPLTDPMDLLVGHELGHALYLLHRNDITALMYPQSQDNDGDGSSDNFALNAAEITTTRFYCQGIPGWEEDPPHEVILGDIVAARRVDEVNESNYLPPYLDLSSVKVSFNVSKGEATFELQLFGLIPDQVDLLNYWILVDVDNQKATGAGENLLDAVGVPLTNFLGAELVIRADVLGANSITGIIWHFQDDQLVQLQEGFIFNTYPLVLYPLYASGAELDEDLLQGVPVHHLISATLENSISEINLEQMFNIQVITVNGSQAWDKLDDTISELGEAVVLEYPSFPHCFPKEDAISGKDIEIEIVGLLPNTQVHGFFDHILVFEGTTNSTGGNIVRFPIPLNTSEGFHYVTFVVENTALTANCVLKITHESKTTPSFGYMLLPSFTALTIIILRRRKN